MLTISNFKSELKALGVDVSAAENGIKIRGNLSAITPEQRDWLRHHKPAVLAMLKMEQSPVRRYVSLDGQAEAYSAHVLDPAYWREA
ncbi:MAG: hypothetical protein ACP5I8_16025 [Phycisphaerae bacterium]